MPEDRRRDEYLDWMAAQLDDPDAYVRYLADKLARAGLEAEEAEPERSASPDDAAPRVTARDRSCVR